MAYEICQAPNFTREENLSWSAYNASLQTDTVKMKALTALLPLFHEQAKSFSMIEHSMKLILRLTRFLNPEQVPVLAMDQPLYAVAKELQWRKTEILGEDKFLVMLGGLHTEMAFTRTIGDFLKNSGWENLLVQASIKKNGRAESMLSASHLTRTRYAHKFQHLHFIF